MEDINESQRAIKEHGIHLEHLPDGSLLARIGGGVNVLYDIAIVLVPVGEGAYEAKGLDKLPSKEQWKMLRTALVADGYEMKFRRLRK